MGEGDAGEDWWNGHQLVFVGGLHRSGKTRLTQCISRCANVSLLDGEPGVEGQHLQPVIPAAAEWGGPGRFAFDERAHLTEHSALASQRTASEIMSAWGPHWDLTRRWLVEESPPNILRTRLLRALFPGAVQVVVLRHPIPVARETQAWSHTSADELLRHWLRAHELLLEDARSVPNLLVVRFESMSSDPGRVTEAVGRHLGLPAGALDSGGLAMDRPRSTRSVLTSWRHRVPRSVARRYRERVLRFGYDVLDPEGVGADGELPMI